MNCCDVEIAIEGVAGVTAIETSARPTVRLNYPVTVPTLAKIEHCPSAFALSRPPAATVAKVLSEELQVAEAVTSCTLPLLYDAEAFSCCVWPAVRLELAAELTTDDRVGLEVCG